MPAVLATPVVTRRTRSAPVRIRSSKVQARSGERVVKPLFVLVVILRAPNRSIRVSLDTRLSRVGGTRNPREFNYLLVYRQAPQCITLRSRVNPSNIRAQSESFVPWLYERRLLTILALLVAMDFFQSINTQHRALDTRHLPAPPPPRSFTTATYAMWDSQASTDVVI
jgi:hypothetical protein